MNWVLVSKIGLYLDVACGPLSLVSMGFSIPFIFAETKFGEALFRLAQALLALAVVGVVLAAVARTQGVIWGVY